MDQANYSGRKILVGIDGSANAAAALAWAVSESQARGASVEAVYVWHEPSMAYSAADSAPGYIPPVAGDIEEMAQHILDDTLKTIPDVHDVKIGLRGASGAPVDILTHAAEEPDVAMTALGTRGHGGVVGLVLGSVSHAMTHHSRKPLAIIPGSWLDTDSQQSKQRIVVGVDGSQESKLALRWAVAEAAARSVSVEAVMVWSTPSPVLPAHLPLGARRLADQESKVEETLRAVVASVATDGVDVECTVLSGHPAAALLARAGTAQLLVVGSRGLGRAHETIAGSVSHACTHHASLPVVVVPNRR